MTETLSGPLVPAEDDLRDFAFMPLDVVRLRDSDLVTEPDGEVFRANVLSWCVGWHQVPAASLPDDDAILARLLGYGRDLRGWRKVRAAGGLRGWVKCSDGRLYHPVVAEKARTAWEAKQSQRQRTEAARNARLQRQQQSEQQSMSQTSGASVTESKGELRDRDSKGNKNSSLRSEARNGTRLPADWKPGHGLLAWAVNDLPAGLDLEAETEKFRDYWTAQPGAKGRKTDWDATWRNWMRKASERLPGYRPPSQQPQHRSGFAAMAAGQDRQPSLTLEGKARHVDE
jgi:hypothetical protein